MSLNNTDPTPTILLLTHCRTASHVLERILSNQSNTIYGSHWFFLTRMQRRVLLRAGPIAEMDPAIPEEYMRLSSEGLSQFLDFLALAQQQGKIPFAHTQPHAMLTPELLSDHVYGRSTISKEVTANQWMAKASSSLQGQGPETHTNPTVVPDWVLLRPGTVPILNFCHPILVCERIYRSFTTLPSYEPEKVHELVSIGATLRWQRLMYEWYLQHGVPLGINPIVLDADDYLGPDKESLMQNLCNRVSCLSPDSILYSWPRTTSGDLAGISSEMQLVHQTLLGSDGVMSGYDMRGRDIETETAKWAEKYGQEEADVLKGFVEKTMPDYEYLMAHRLRPGTAL
jgi:hypothetical protein